MKIENGFRHAHSTLAGSIELPAHENVDHCMERPRFADSIERIIGKNGNDLSSSPFSQHDLKSFSLRFDELNEVHEKPDETLGQTPAKSTPGAKNNPGSKNLLNWFSVSGAQMAFEIRKQGAQTNLQTEVGTSTSAKPEAQTNLQTEVGTSTSAKPEAQTNLQTEVGTSTSAKPEAQTNLQTEVGPSIRVDPTETADMDQKVETKVDTNKTVETEATNMDQKVDTEVGTNTPATPKAQTNLQTEVGPSIRDMDQKVETKVDTNKTVETEATNMDQKVDTEVDTNQEAEKGNTAYDCTDLFGDDNGELHVPAIKENSNLVKADIESLIDVKQLVCVAPPWCRLLASGEKTWELRSYQTKTRFRVASWFFLVSWLPGIIYGHLRVMHTNKYIYTLMLLSGIFSQKYSDILSDIFFWHTICHLQSTFKTYPNHILKKKHIITQFKFNLNS